MITITIKIIGNRTGGMTAKIQRKIEVGEIRMGTITKETVTLEDTIEKTERILITIVQEGEAEVTHHHLK